MLHKLLAAAAATVALHGGAIAQQTIKLGLLNIDGGAFAVIAGKTGDAATFAVDELNARGGALGRRYELVTQLHSGSPASAIAATSALVEQKGVTLIGGAGTTAIALAISSKLTGLGALYLDATAVSDELTGKSCSANFFRVGISDSMQARGLRELIKQSKVKSWDSLVVDFAAGHDFQKLTSGLVQELGGSARPALFAPMTTADFGGYISQLAPKTAEGLFVYMPGSPGIALAKQQKEYGLFPKYKYIIGHFAFVNELVLDAQGDSTVDVHTAASYHWAMPGEANAAFVKAYEARYKRKPSPFEADTYTTYMLMHAAIVKAKSTEPDAVRAALAGLKAATIVGDLEMRAADHQLLRPLALVQVVKADDGKSAMALRSIEPIAAVTPPVDKACKL